ncbi:hypothetical protein SAMN02910358_02601 [Lachnospiraceae bacterium XBB1006]|nr:hypothetical protein SAMN02910358_02601 [Lachnospiraceae bacterium XBB1006]
MNAVDSKNYLKLDNFSLFKVWYAFIDTKDHLADQLFIRHKVRVYFIEDYQYPDADYQVIICKVKRKDEKEFLVALRELAAKMLLCGHSDYEVFSELLIEKLEKEAVEE